MAVDDVGGGNVREGRHQAFLGVVVLHDPGSVPVPVFEGYVQIGRVLGQQRHDCIDLGLPTISQSDRRGRVSNRSQVVAQICHPPWPRMLVGTDQAGKRSRGNIAHDTGLHMSLAFQAQDREPLAPEAPGAGV